MRVKTNYIILLIVCFLGAKNLNAQEEEKYILTEADLAQIQVSEAELGKWFEALKTPGVKVEGNTMYFSEEAQRLIKDVAYRKAMYKGKYGLTDVKHSLEMFDFQKAFYQLITMYPENKEHVVSYIYAYDKMFPTDEVVIASFYTYAFFDPAITEITDGKPKVHRPDIFEEYLRRSNEIVSYIHYFRKEAEKGKS